MKFSVVVKKADGTQETQAIEADSRFAVYSQVERDGGTVASLREGTGGLPAWMNITIGGSVNTETKITFTKNLSAMLAAGLTLSRALSVIERQSANPILKKVVIDLEDKIKSGTSFHEALQNHTKIFSKLFIAMTKAGEEGGTLSDTLKVVAKQMDQAETLTKKVKGAMIYPCIILVAIVIIAILMLIFVVPTLAATFEQLGAALPLSTKIILASSAFVTHNLIVVLVALVILVIGGTIFFRSKPGTTTILFVAMRMPVIGELVKETFSARAARTLSSLLTSGVEMLNALSITQEVVGDNVFGNVVAEATTRVRKGEALSASFVEHPKLYPILFGDMVTVGEETGKVADMLSQVAEYYETDVEDRTKDLSTIIEPLLMLFIGLFVGVFAVSMIAPIYSLSSAI
ncbi:MAG: type II secretion system F family protein [Candidatus Pacebacteria bacterium]|nr:type II secretion system F family protein [Candidatus Paceibacterota bacterium]